MRNSRKGIVGSKVVFYNVVRDVLRPRDFSSGQGFIILLKNQPLREVQSSTSKQGEAPETTSATLFLSTRLLPIALNEPVIGHRT